MHILIDYIRDSVDFKDLVQIILRLIQSQAQGCTTGSSLAELLVYPNHRGLVLFDDIQQLFMCLRCYVYHNTSFCDGYAGLFLISNAGRNAPESITAPRWEMVANSLETVSLN